MTLDRSLIKWVLIIASIVLAALWLIMSLGTSAVPDWVPPVALLCLAVGVAIPAP